MCYLSDHSFVFINKINKFTATLHLLACAMVHLISLYYRTVTHFFSYGMVVATSSAISAALSVSFGIYYAMATNFPLTELMLKTLTVFTAVAVVGHSIIFGLLNRIGLPGFTWPVLALSRNIITKPDLQIKRDMKAEEYQNLLQALTVAPLYNALTAVFFAQLIIASLFVAAEFSMKVEMRHYILGLIIDIMASFIHAGFSLVIGEIITGDMRAECKRLMHEKGFPFADRAVTTVRQKLIFFIVLFLMTIYVVSTLVYFNRSNMEAILIFTLMAMIAAMAMAYMIFFLIYSSLKDIETAMDDLKSGGTGLVFTKSISKEFVKVAAGISDAAKTIKDYQANLEHKIEERTQELADSLVKVNALKGQQDGDYFLTSLLLKPLTGNYANNRQMKVNIFIRQKKVFEFKTKTNEIGGDICIAHSICLRDRNYTLFLNGDAMGKSMQGAGGSLVLGAVLQSIVERTKLSSKEQTLYPERWLKSIFIELQKTFESFDGSMLISIILGLADEENGFVYLLNAEHPWSVLYRRGEAQFIENALMLRKLGTLGVSMGIQVQTLQMKPHDILILGSDGRDDLLTGTNEEGARIINEDENLFLKHTVDGHGNLEGIYEACRATGDITDDFSLMSITYLPEEISPSARDDIRAQIQHARALVAKRQYGEAVAELEKAFDESSPASREHLARALAQVTVKIDDHERALKYFSIYTDANPADTQAIFTFGQLCIKEGRIEQAFDIFNRLRIRNHKDEKAAIQIAKILIQKGDPKTAEEILIKFVESGKENLKIKAILDSIADSNAAMGSSVGA